MSLDGVGEFLDIDEFIGDKTLKKHIHVLETAIKEQGIEIVKIKEWIKEHKETFKLHN